MSLSSKTLDALKNSEFWTSKTKDNGRSIRDLVCPACGDKSAWAYSDSPNSINCNRLSECGYRTNTLELFNIKQDFEKEYKPTNQDKHRPARAYLQSRGLNKALKNLQFEYWPKVRRLKTGAVMFRVGNNSEGKPVYNGRLFNPPAGEGKTHNRNSTTSQFWCHPGMKYDQEQPVYVCEGIVDALSLIEIGLQAIAVLAAGQDPKLIDLSKYGKHIFAFDNDPAGHKATRLWLKHYPDAAAILPDRGRDWNDLLQSCRGDSAGSVFNKNLPRYVVNKNLALAKSAKEYAVIYYDFHNQVPGLFVHNSSTYFSYLRKKGDEATVMVERCGLFSLKVLSFFKDTSNPGQHEYSYLLQITPKGGRPLKATASGRDLATGRGIREFLLTRAKVSFEGGTQASTAFATRITSAKNVPEVTVVPLTGLDIMSNWYIFNSFAVDPQGKIHRPGKNGMYKTSYHGWSVPPAHSSDKAITPVETGPPVKDIHDLIVQSWGHRGAASFAWVVSSWFVNQIKGKIGFFPFISLWGDVQAAKSSLTVILNQVQGFDTEGSSTSSMSTRKGIARNIGRVSNLFSAIIEGNTRDERAAFDYSSLLPLYNRNPLSVKAVFTNDMQTAETPFSGALLFSSNLEVFRGKAEKERVVSIEFKTDYLTKSSQAAYEKLSKIPLQIVARTILLTLQYRKVFEKEWYSSFQQASKELAAVKNRRIRENHALLLGFHRLFCKVHGIKNSRLKDFLEETAKIKEITAAQKEYTLADDFFDKVDLIPEEKLYRCVCMDEKNSLIYFHLAGIEQQLRHIGISFSANERLFEALRMHPGFIKASHLKKFPRELDLASDIGTKVRRTWKFDAKKMK